MPRPVTQILSRQHDEGTLWALGQDEYVTLPTIVGNPPTKPVTSRWTFTPEERAKIAAGGDLWITQLMFSYPSLQPIIVRTDEPTLDECMNVEV